MARVDEAWGQGVGEKVCQKKYLGGDHKGKPQ